MAVQAGEVLFEVTEANLETGLRGIPVGYCTTSSVDPQKGLFYRGRPVSELAYWSPEEVIFLLVHGKVGSKEEVGLFSQQLQKRALCPPRLIEAIDQLPRAGHPMKMFGCALLLLGMLDSKGDYQEDTLNVIAKMPEFCAALINHHAGWGRTPPSNPELGYMENFVHLLQAPDKDANKLLPVFRLFNILHYDHGGGNLSTFTGKAIASGREDLYGSLCGAMCALAGPLHGRANQDCLESVQALAAEAGMEGSSEALEKVVRKRLQEGKVLFGFGHAVLRVEDPRATLELEMLQKLFPDDPQGHFLHKLREVGVKVLKENPKISNPYPNVDFVSGTLLSAAGFPYPEYYTLLFGMSRCVGIALQIIYERKEARGGKGTPIVRPRYFYRGPTA